MLCLKLNFDRDDRKEAVKLQATLQLTSNLIHDAKTSLLFIHERIP